MDSEQPKIDYLDEMEQLAQDRTRLENEFKLKTSEYRYNALTNGAIAIGGILALCALLATLSALGLGSAIPTIISILTGLGVVGGALKVGIMIGKWKEKANN